MDPSSPSEGSVEPKERRKIQFAVPPTEPTQLDPRQVEMRLLGKGNRKGLSGGRLQIRRRRPTPATLFKVADQTSPEDDISTHQWVVGENGVLKPKRINPNIYQPPSLKAVQQMAEAHMQKLGVYPHVEEEGEEPIQRGGEEISSSCTPDSQEQRGMAEHQLGMRKAGATAPTDEEEEEEEVEADNMADDECRNVD